ARRRAWRVSRSRRVAASTPSGRRSAALSSQQPVVLRTRRLRPLACPPVRWNSLPAGKLPEVYPDVASNASAPGTAVGETTGRPPGGDRPVEKHDLRAVKQQPKAFGDAAVR